MEEVFFRLSCSCCSHFDVGLSIRDHCQGLSYSWSVTFPAWRFPNFSANEDTNGRKQDVKLPSHLCGLRSHPGASDLSRNLYSLQAPHSTSNSCHMLSICGVLRGKAQTDVYNLQTASGSLRTQQVQTCIAKPRFDLPTHEHD